MSSSKESFCNSYMIYAFIRGIDLSIEYDIKESIKGTNLSFPAIRSLWMIYFDPDITMSKLAQLSLTNISNVFRQLVKLEELGFVSIKDGKDARTKDMIITEAGQNFVKDYIHKQSHSPFFKIVNFVEDSSKEELNQLLKCISQLSDALNGNEYSNWVKNCTNKILNE